MFCSSIMRLATCPERAGQNLCWLAFAFPASPCYSLPMWSALNRLDIDPDDPSYSDVRRRVLGRLGEYASLVSGPVNLRPTTAALLREDDQRVDLRVSTPSSHVVLVIATDGDLTPEVFWLRALDATNLPIPRLIAHDLSLTTLPFAYALESYIGGSPLDWLEDGPRMRVLARQAG